MNYGVGPHYPINKWMYSWYSVMYGSQFVCVLIFCREFLEQLSAKREMVDEASLDDELRQVRTPPPDGAAFTLFSKCLCNYLHLWHYICKKNYFLSFACFRAIFHTRLIPYISSAYSALTVLVGHLALFAVCGAM